MRILIMFLLSIFALFANPTLFQSVEADKATILQSGKDKEYCPVCGMNLPMFYKTNHVLKLKNGDIKQFCSIHCLVDFLTNGKIDLKDAKKDAKEVLVVDTTTNKLIDVRVAHYVIGSKIKGTMSKVSQYAFATQDDAIAFQKANGGEIGNFEDALKKATEDFSSDNMVIEDKKAEKALMGEKIYNSQICDKSKLQDKHFHIISETKTYLKDSGACKNLNEAQLHSLALYLVSKDSHTTTKKEPLSVKKDDKCPVCGMFVEPYKKWVAKIEFENSKYLVFDGAKDMFKLYFEPQKFGVKELFKSIHVTDYYDVFGIDAKKACYVIHSDVFGPMGSELIPFETKDKCDGFVKDHGGKVIKFEDITKDIVYSLDK